MVVFEASWLEPFFAESEHKDMSIPVQKLKAVYSETLLAVYHSTSDSGNKLVAANNTNIDDDEDTPTPQSPARVALTERQCETAMARFRRKKIMEDRKLTRIWSRVLIAEESIPLPVVEYIRPPLSREQQDIKATCLRRKTSMRLSGITRVWDVTATQGQPDMRHDLFWGGSDTLDQSPKNRRMRRKRIMIRRGLSQIWRLSGTGCQSARNSILAAGNTVEQNDTCHYNSRVLTSADSTPDRDYDQYPFTPLIEPFMAILAPTLPDTDDPCHEQYLAMDI